MIISETWKQTKCPPMKKCMNNAWYILKLKYNTTTEKTIFIYRDKYEVYLEREREIVK